MTRSIWLHTGGCLTPMLRGRIGGKLRALFFTLTLPANGTGRVALLIVILPGQSGWQIMDIDSCSAAVRWVSASFALVISRAP
ncbi:hypothetical protein BLN97_38715 [Bradyrhizobium elkanii]|nr:hypothetical protein BLN97_38715 [Bradyrhizobium elkanii]